MLDDDTGCLSLLGGLYTGGLDCLRFAGTTRSGQLTTTHDAHTCTMTYNYPQQHNIEYI